MSSSPVLSNAACKLFHDELPIEQQLMPKTDIIPSPNEKKEVFFYRQYVPLITACGPVTIYSAFKPVFDEEQKCLKPDLSSHCYCFDFSINSLPEKKLYIKQYPQSRKKLTLEQLEAAMQAIGTLKRPADKKKQ